MYYELSKYRHDMNGVPHYEPNGDETFELAGPSQLPINSARSPVAFVDRTVHPIAREVPGADLERAFGVDDVEALAVDLRDPEGVGVMDLRAVPRCDVTTATMSSAPFVARQLEREVVGEASVDGARSPRTRIGRP